MNRPLAVALLTLALPGAASAFEQIRCLDDSGPAHYADDVVPSLGLSAFGREQDAAVRRAFASWNEVPGARAQLVEDPPLTGCGAPPTGGRFSWSDPVACYSILGFAAGVTIHAFDEQDPCTIVAVEVLMDSEFVGRSDDELVEMVALHELGHALLLDHDWDDLTVMGYADVAGANPIALFADDHEARFLLAPDGAAQPPLVRLRDFRLSSPVPGHHSFTRIFAPDCSPEACLRAERGTELMLTATVENLGAEPRTSPLRLVLRLAPSTGGEAIVLAEYAFAELAAHSSWTGSLGGVPPAELPDDLYDLTLSIEADGLDEAQLDPDARTLIFRESYRRGAPPADPRDEYLADDGPPAPEGCGCGGAGGASLGGLAVALLALGTARRRRS